MRRRRATRSAAIPANRHHPGGLQREQVADEGEEAVPRAATVTSAAAARSSRRRTPARPGRAAGRCRAATQDPGAAAAATPSGPAGTAVGIRAAAGSTGRRAAVTAYGAQDSYRRCSASQPRPASGPSRRSSLSTHSQRKNRAATAPATRVRPPLSPGTPGAATPRPGVADRLQGGAERGPVADGPQHRRQLVGRRRRSRPGTRWGRTPPSRSRAGRLAVGATAAISSPRESSAGAPSTTASDEAARGARHRHPEGQRADRDQQQHREHGGRPDDQQLGAEQAAGRTGVAPQPAQHPALPVGGQRRRQDGQPRTATRCRPRSGDVLGAGLAAEVSGSPKPGISRSQTSSSTGSAEHQQREDRLPEEQLGLDPVASALQARSSGLLAVQRAAGQRDERVVERALLQPQVGDQRRARGRARR